MTAISRTPRTTTSPQIRPQIDAPPSPGMLQRLRGQSPALVTGVVITLFILLIAVAAPLIAPYGPTDMNPVDRLQAPSIAHPFGTDIYGRDLFSRVLHGARLSLSVAAGAVVVGAIPGVLLGIIAGTHCGLIEHILTQCMDAWLALPALLVALVMAATLGRSMWVLMFALGIAGVPLYYRMARAEALRISSELYLTAASSLGASPWYILRWHVLPNIMPALIVLVSLRVGRLLLAVSAMSFIGLGTPPPSPEWGTLLADGKEYMQQAWWLTFFPGVAIALTVFGFNMLGDGLRDVIDPHRKCRG